MRPIYYNTNEKLDNKLERYEETAMNRVALTKKQKKKRKARIKDAMMDKVRNNADFRIMEEIVKMQEGNAEQEKERQEQNLKLKKLVKSYNSKGKRGRLANDDGNHERKRKHKKNDL